MSNQTANETKCKEVDDKGMKMSFFDFILQPMQPTKRNIQLISKYGKKKAVERKDRRLTADAMFGTRQGLLMSCYNAWYSLSDSRTKWRRNEEFVYGDQWSDRVYDHAKQRWVTQRQLFIEKGIQPNQYNILRNIIRSVDGIWRSNKTLPVCVAQKDENQPETEILTATNHALYRKNELQKLHASLLTQLMICGVIATDNNFTVRGGDADIYNDYIDLFSFFVDNTMKDPRYNDCSLVGYFLDMTVDDIVGAFSHGDRKRGEQIRNMYRGLDNERIMQMAQTFSDQRLEKDFFTPPVETWGLGRVIKVWRKESAQCLKIHDRLHGKAWSDYKLTEQDLQNENADRRRQQRAMGVADEDMQLLEWEWSTDTFWKYYFLTPTGQVLDEGINPYWHEKPSIVFEFHEWFVGKVNPFITDVIDVQKQINTITATSELLTRYSAKSVLFMPKQFIDGVEGGIEKVKNEMAEYDAVIEYEAKQGYTQKPEYVNNIAQALTPLNMINMSLQLSEKVSGVYGALQGSAPTAGTPAQMYAQQTQNSSTSLNGIYDIMYSFRKKSDTINVQLMQQFYKGKKYIFDTKSNKMLAWDQDKVKNIEFEMTTAENTDTPAYRLMVNQALMDLKQFDVQNQLDLRGLIETGSWPFKEEILNYLNKREQEAKEAYANGQTPAPGGGLPPDLQQKLGQYQFSPEVQQQFANLSPEMQQQVMEQVGQN